MRRAMSLRRAGTWIALVLAAHAVTACSGSSNPKPAPVVDPNILPVQYQLLVAKYLRTELTDKEDFIGALISQPEIKPIGSSNRYVVCLRFNGHSQIKDKVAIFLSGSITQFITSTPAQCGDAQYQPFRELEAIAPG
jgi:hypothetical protein